MQIIQTELLLKDQAYLEERVEELAGKIKRQSSKELIEDKALLDKALALLNDGKWIR